MSTLADRFLDDFNDVDESLINLNNNNNNKSNTNTNNINNKNNSLANELMDDMDDMDDDEDNGSQNENTNDGNIEEDNIDPNDLLLGDQDDLMLSDEMIEKKQNELIKKYKDSPIESIAKLNGSNKLLKLLERIDKQMVKPLPDKGVKTGQNDEEHTLIVDCNQMAQEIQHEIYLIHKFVRDRYSKKFPELESSVQNPLDYINVVKRIKNENDLTNVELNDILPKSTIMVLLVTLSSTTGKNLTEEELKKVLDACEMGLELDIKKKRILNYLESRMTYIAPNVSVLLGSSIASKLIGIAGGIHQLSVIAAGYLQTFGADKKSLAGFSGINNRKFQSGLISQCDIVKKAPPHLQVKAIRVLTGKVSLAARIDAQQESSFYGEMGRTYRDKILADIEKWQEPPPQKQEKALPAPDDRPKKRRGGAKARKYKEKFKITEIQKAKNRMAFNVEEKTIGDTGIGLGMLGGESGRLRIVAQEKNILKKQKKFEQKSYGGTTTNIGGSQTNVSGLSSVAITPSQGLQLQVTQNTREQSNKTEKYFSSSGFKRKFDDKS